MVRVKDHKQQHLFDPFDSHPEVTEMYSFKLLKRIVNEQCEVSEDGSSVEVKPAKQIRSDSLQNPSDPDATYSGHKSQGYQVQIMGTEQREEAKLSNFEFFPDGHIAQCPAGKKPVVKKKKKTRFSQGFDLSVCDGCPLVESCPARFLQIVWPFGHRS